MDSVGATASELMHESVAKLWSGLSASVVEHFGAQATQCRVTVVLRDVRDASAPTWSHAHNAADGASEEGSELTS